MTNMNMEKLTTLGYKVVQITDEIALIKKEDGTIKTFIGDNKIEELAHGVNRFGEKGGILTVELWGDVCRIKNYNDCRSCYLSDEKEWLPICDSDSLYKDSTIIIDIDCETLFEKGKILITCTDRKTDKTVQAKLAKAEVGSDCFYRLSDHKIIINRVMMNTNNGRCARMTDKELARYTLITPKARWFNSKLEEGR